MSHARLDDAGRLLRGSTDLLVLSVLAEEPLYGYAIIKRVQARSDGALRLTPGFLYPLLHQMEKQGMLLASWDAVQADDNDAEDGGRKRKWYRLSAKGRRQLERRTEAHRLYQQMLESFLPGSAE